MSQWRFYLADALDLRNHIGELSQARGRSISVGLNQGGSLSFNYPMNEALSASIQPVTSAVKAYRQRRDGTWRLVWSGMVWTVDDAIHEKKMTVTCVGWFERLAKRLLRINQNWTNQDDGTIIFDLLAQANLTTWSTAATPPQDINYTVPVPVGAYPNTPTLIQAGAKLPNEGLGGATAYANALRSRSVQRYTSIGQLIQEFTQYENGCDIEITPEDRFLNIYRKKMRDTGVVFGYGWGPANLRQLNRQIDSSSLVNLVQVMGQPGVTGGMADTTAPPFVGWPGDTDYDTRDNYGLMEEVVTLSEVSNTNILATYAAAEIFVRYRPRVVYTMTPFNYTPGTGVPEPFEDYDVGDRVYLTANNPPRLVLQNQAVRVFGIQANIDDNGNEQIGQLQTAPS